MNSDNVTSLRRPDGSRPALREVISNRGTTSGPDERINDYLRRFVWPQNTEKQLAAWLRVQSTAGCKAKLAGRISYTTKDVERLAQHPQCGRRFVLHAYGYPEDPDYSEFLTAMEKLREKIADI